MPGTVSGSVFSDLNGDGAQGTGEGGLGGVVVDLLDSVGTVVATTTTAGDGSYVFAAVRITPTVMLGKGHNQGGGIYQRTDAEATPGQVYSYWLQEVELNGSTNEYGPATSGGGAVSNLHKLYLSLVTN